MNYVDPIRNQEHVHKSQISSEIRTHEHQKAMRDESLTQAEVLKQAQNKTQAVTQTENLVQTDPDGGKGKPERESKNKSKGKGKSTESTSKKKLPPKLYGGQFIDTSA
jgi:hypothetical protein